MKHIHRGKLVSLLILTGILWSGLTLFSDTDHILESVKHLSMRRMLTVLGLSSINYWIRVIRFNWLTQRVAQAPIKKDVNTIIFFSGLSMNLTPARIGELVKAYFQQKLFGESFARMAPIVFVERLSDSLAMLLMMSVGVLAFRMGVGLFLTLVVLVSVVVLVVHRKQLGRRVVRFVQNIPGGTHLATPVDRALSTSYRLTGFWPLTISTALGVCAWVAEASGIWVLLGGVGIPLTTMTLYLTWFTFSVSAAAGFLSVVPAGLGVNELSTIGLLEKLVGLTFSDSLVVTFAFRLVTLWFGVFLGLVSLIYLERQIKS